MPAKGRERAEEAARQGREMWNRQRETIATAFERGKRSVSAGAGRPAARYPVRGGDVNDWSGLFLGVIALATLMMASIQIGALVFAARLGRQLQQLAATVQNDIRPLIARRQSHCRRGAKTAAIATAQAQKIDRLMTDVSRRVDETSSIVQTRHHDAGA